MQKMKYFSTCFVQNADGSWFCRAPAEFIDQTGKLWNATPGATYRAGNSLVGGHDIAKWLTDWVTYNAVPPGITFRVRPYSA
jgi:hypothetical protein